MKKSTSIPAKYVLREDFEKGGDGRGTIRQLEKSCPISLPKLQVYHLVQLRSLTKKSESFYYTTELLVQVIVFHAVL